MSKTMTLARKKLSDKIMVDFAEYYRAMISERTKRGIQAKKAKKK